MTEFERLQRELKKSEARVDMLLEVIQAAAHLVHTMGKAPGAKKEASGAALIVFSMHLCTAEQVDFKKADPAHFAVAVMENTLQAMEISGTVPDDEFLRMMKLRS